MDSSGIIVILVSAVIITVFIGLIVGGGYGRN